MSAQKPYLDNSLTLQGLAEQTNSSERQLSFLINKVLGQHFYDYINSYRIEEACRLLTQNDLNIQQIMYEVGFNSKSSFNTAFKKNTGQTPSQFRDAARHSMEN
jgi:AraC-like DNA-binding protein